MTPRQLAAEAGEPTYLGGSVCSRGHSGPRYTANGNCVECTRSSSAPAAADPRLRYLSLKLHEVRADVDKAAARVKAAVRQFEAAADDLKRWRASEAVAREHRTLEDLQREAAALDLDVEAHRPRPDAGRMAILLAAAGAPPTPPPRSYVLTPATDTEIQAVRHRQCPDPDQVFHRAREEQTRLVRETARARLKAAYPDRPWTTEEGAAVLEQVRADLNLPPLPVIESAKEDADERHEALRARLLSTGD